jgi:ribosomal protein L30E
LGAVLHFRQKSSGWKEDEKALGSLNSSLQLVRKSRKCMLGDEHTLKRTKQGKIKLVTLSNIPIFEAI